MSNLLLQPNLSLHYLESWTRRSECFVLALTHFNWKANIRSIAMLRLTVSENTFINRGVLLESPACGVISAAWYRLRTNKTKERNSEAEKNLTVKQNLGAEEIKHEESCLPGLVVSWNKRKQKSPELFVGSHVKPSSNHQTVQTPVVSVRLSHCLCFCLYITTGSIMGKLGLHWAPGRPVFHSMISTHQPQESLNEGLQFGQ